MESEANKQEFEAFRKSRVEYEDILKDGSRFGIPVLFYKDELVMGFDKKKIDELIEKAK